MSPFQTVMGTAEPLPGWALPVGLLVLLLFVLLAQPRR